MNAKSRRHLLQAWDELNAIAFGGRPTGEIGDPRACDNCGGIRQCEPHCLIGELRGVLLVHIPAFHRREHFIRTGKG